MKKLRVFITLIFLSILCASFILPDDWILFESSTCKMSFPKKPSQSSQILNTNTGELKLNMYLYEVPENVNDENLVYCLAETEYPDTLVNSNKSKKELIVSFLRNIINVYVKNVHGNLVSEKLIKYDSFPGREIRIDLKDEAACIKARFYLIGKKVYMLQVVTDKKNNFNKSIDRFLTSFVLKK